MATTVLEALLEATDSAGIGTFRFANITEFQSFLDSFEYSDYPINVVIPFTSQGTTINGRRKSIVTIEGWVLRRISEDTNDFRTEAVETAYLQALRTLAIKFLLALQQTDIIDTDNNASVRDTIRPEYAFLNAHLFGVSYSIQLPVVESACVVPIEYIIQEDEQIISDELGNNLIVE